MTNVNRSETSLGGARHARAWSVLVAALALHVADEAATGFLDFYNPLVLSIRKSIPWSPVPSRDPTVAVFRDPARGRAPGVTQ
jgi:hypothetical protein